MNVCKCIAVALVLGVLMFPVCLGLIVLRDDERIGSERKRRK